jgi:RNA polymerase-binding transcription factor
MRSARPASTEAAPGTTARAPRSATPSTRWRQPSSVGTSEWARATTMLAPSTRSRPSSPARPRMSSRPEMSRSSSAWRKLASACSDARSGARRRSTSDAMSVVTSFSSAVPGSLRARIRRVPTGASATRRSIASTPAASSSSERSSAGERAATASTAPPRSVSTRLASSARAAARTTSGRPAPDSTASVIASSAPRSIPVAGPWAGVDMHRFYGEGRAEADGEPALRRLFDPRTRSPRRLRRPPG